MEIIVGVTGASGSCYARRLIEVLSSSHHRCHLIATAAAEAVIGHELGEVGMYAGEEVQRVRVIDVRGHGHDVLEVPLGDGATAELTGLHSLLQVRDRRLGQVRLHPRLFTPARHGRASLD